MDGFRPVLACAESRRTTSTSGLHCWVCEVAKHTNAVLGRVVAHYESLIASVQAVNPAATFYPIGGTTFSHRISSSRLMKSLALRSAQ